MPRGGRALLVAALVALLGMVLSAGSAGAGNDDLAESVVEVILPTRDAVDRLVATGVDLNHGLEFTADGIVAQVVVNPDELAELRAQGFETGDVVFTPADSEARLAERQAIIDAKRRAAGGGIAALRQGKAAAAAALADAVTILRTDYFTSGGSQFLSVEAKTNFVGTPNPTLTLRWDSGPGTPMGSGGTTTLSRYVDAGAYMYHLRQVTVTSRPDLIEVSSSAGGSATAPAKDWLLPVTNPGTGVKVSDFVDHYLDPSELYSRIEQLHDQFPQITQLIELPNKTGGYQRKSMALLAGTADPDGSPGPSTAQQGYAVAVESKAWGQNGGNDVFVELKDPAAANQPLTVSALGSYVLVTLATNATGGLTSTAAQVIAAINASPAAAALVYAHTYRGNAGAGVVQPRAATQLDDFLNAPDSIKRGPFTVKMLRISGKLDGSNTGVFVYAQEHAREWVPPQISVEFAERLLRNYAIDTRTRQLVNQLDIFVLPSVNPDGGTYSFYDFGSQRRNMTNHCTDSNTDPARRTAWGVDVNRNYAFGSMFDGYSGASSSCTNDVFSGPAELSEPESANVVWVADHYPNIKYSMNTHSSGNYFMWAPGAYKTSCGGVTCRELLPRPDAGTEAYFWAASQKVLSAIKQYRGFSITPARTGPVADVLYSAAGNSGDHLYYLNDIFAWDFEVGTSFQPNWTEAHELTMEFANGMYGLLEVAWARDHDWQKPESKVVVLSREPGKTRFMLDSTEPSVIFYTLDGSKPMPSSARYPVNGDREYGKIFEVTTKTDVGFYAVDMAGNIENGYKAGGKGVGGNRFNRMTITVD
jgi:hypothetical protein